MFQQGAQKQAEGELPPSLSTQICVLSLFKNLSNPMCVSQLFLGVDPAPGVTELKKTDYPTLSSVGTVGTARASKA